MVPFKNIFLGIEQPTQRRVVDSQKCLRVSGKHNDLEEVGRDTYHHTFFEMLGNWSFGDYWKRDAIAWAWELLTAVWKLPKDKLSATVYTTDDEAAALWREVTDIGRDRISRFEEENFWEMGDTGPCGPCSEIHIDRGPGACARQGTAHRCAVNAGCARFIEIWNLVFIQYNRDAAGALSELPAKHVDTGMGFERVTAVLQGVPSNYDIDVFRRVIASAEQLADKRYGGEPRDDVSLRGIADHARAVTLPVQEGLRPADGGRGAEPHGRASCSGSAARSCTRSSAAWWRPWDAPTRRSPGTRRRSGRWSVRRRSASPPRSTAGSRSSPKRSSGHGGARARGF